MTKQQERKQAIRTFMQNHYSDERLAALLAHARDGKLQYYSCCCFIGAARANALIADYTKETPWHDRSHYDSAKLLKGAEVAETAYAGLSQGVWGFTSDTIRQRILIPIIRAEMKRREYARKKISQTQEVPALQEVEVGR